MKKIFALMLCVAMLATLAVGTSAAGEILWNDDFTNGFNPNYWIVENNLYFIDDSDVNNPCLAAYNDGVVSQMEYRLGMMFTNCAIVSKIQIRDFDADGKHSAGFWWRDDFHYSEDDSEPEYELGEVWNLLYNADDGVVELLAEGEESPRVTAPVSGVEVGGDWFTLGWRVTPGHMEGFLNNAKVIDYYSEDISAQYPSPFLLLNGHCYTAFDDIVVATADYDLFGEGLGENNNNNNTNNNNNNNNTTTTPKVTTTSEKAVTVTDSRGNAVTDAEGNAVTSISIVTEAAAPADTNTNGPAGGNATSTGDATFVVIAAMIAVLGCAVIVKKVSVK